MAGRNRDIAVASADLGARQIDFDLEAMRLAGRGRTGGLKAQQVVGLVLAEDSVDIGLRIVRVDDGLATRVVRGFDEQVARRGMQIDLISRSPARGNEAIRVETIEIDVRPLRLTVQVVAFGPQAASQIAPVIDKKESLPTVRVRAE